MHCYKDEQLSVVAVSVWRCTRPQCLAQCRVLHATKFGTAKCLALAATCRCKC